MSGTSTELTFVFSSSSARTNIIPSSDVELYFEEHFDEVRQRLSYTLIYFLFVTIATFFNIKTIVEILENSASGIHFFQLAPGEYFVTTLVIVLYSGVLFSIPILLTQFLFFFQPALSSNEEKVVKWLFVSSVGLFILGLFFSYFILIPAALNFFIKYGSDLIEPFWSFNQYFKFISTLFFSTGIVFQIPIIQVLLSIFRVVDPKIMLQFWRSILLVASIISAIITPSADPITQLLLTTALFLLYLVGSNLAIFLQKI